MLRYSIIIPHKNSLDFLQIAVNSIPDRSDLEIIIVDNSTEVSSQLIKTKFATNKRIHILFSDSGKGAGHARNIGLRQAQGKWLLFLDCDDIFIDGAFLEFDRWVNSNCDIIYFKVNSTTLDSVSVSERHIGSNNLVSDFLENKLDSSDRLRYYFITPWGKLIRRELIKSNNILFDEVPASNDLMFSVKSGHLAKNIDASNHQVYCVTESGNSLTKIKSRKNQRSRFNIAIEQFKYMSAIGKNKYRFRLLPMLLESFDFDLKEFVIRLGIIIKNRINIFSGSKIYFNRILKKLGLG